MSYYQTEVAKKAFAHWLQNRGFKFDRYNAYFPLLSETSLRAESEGLLDENLFTANLETLRKIRASFLPDADAQASAEALDALIEFRQEVSIAQQAAYAGAALKTAQDDAKPDPSSKPVPHKPKPGERRVKFSSISRKRLAHSKPTRCFYKGNQLYYSKNDWSDLYIVLIKRFFEEYEPVFAKSLVNRPFPGHARVYLGDSRFKGEMIAPERIADDLYIDTNSDTHKKLKDLRYILRKCGVKFSQVAIYYRPKSRRASEVRPPVEQATLFDDLDDSPIPKPADVGKSTAERREPADNAPEFSWGLFEILLIVEALDDFKEGGKHRAEVAKTVADKINARADANRQAARAAEEVLDQLDSLAFRTSNGSMGKEGKLAPVFLDVLELRNNHQDVFQALLRALTD